ncbi:MAG: hypothetical protein ACT6FC_05390 [Methanosarcinaceae archaeon]
MNKNTILFRQEITIEELKKIFIANCPVKGQLESEKSNSNYGVTPQLEFKKRHYNVIQKIENTIERSKRLEITGLIFKVSEYKVV